MNSDDKDRYEAFVTALRALCQQHGFAISIDIADMLIARPLGPGEDPVEDIHYSAD